MWRTSAIDTQSANKLTALQNYSYYYDYQMAQLTKFLTTLSNSHPHITHLKKHTFLLRIQTSRKGYTYWGYPPKILKESFVSYMYAQKINSFNISLQLSDWEFWSRSNNGRFYNTSFHLRLGNQTSLCYLEEYHAKILILSVHYGAHN